MYSRRMRPYHYCQKNFIIWLIFIGIFSRTKNLRHPLTTRFFSKCWFFMFSAETKIWDHPRKIVEISTLVILECDYLSKRIWYKNMKTLIQWISWSKSNNKLKKWKWWIYLAHDVCGNPVAWNFLKQIFLWCHMINEVGWQNPIVCFDYY